MDIGTHFHLVNDVVHQSGKQAGRPAKVKTFAFAIEVSANPPIPIPLRPRRQIGA
jgi:hypothetical protein